MYCTYLDDMQTVYSGLKTHFLTYLFLVLSFLIIVTVFTHLTYLSLYRQTRVQFCTFKLILVIGHWGCLYLKWFSVYVKKTCVFRQMFNLCFTSLFLYFVCTQSCYRIILNSTVNPPLKHNPPRSILACIPIKRGDLYMDRIIWYHNPYFVQRGSDRGSLV